MNRPDYNTSYLWRAFLTLISALLFFVILTLVYLPMRDTIQSYFDKPTYSKEQLEKMAETRQRQARADRKEDWNLIEKGMHVKTGLKADENLQLIIQSCTSCHSAKLITQNRASRMGWKNMIDWMQATQGLTDLGDREPLILDYLAEHYAPEEEGRRANLDVEEIEWYILNLEESGD